MKKIAIVMGRSEIVVKGPDDWNTQLAQGIAYLEVQTVEDRTMCFNTAKISSVRDVTDIEFNSWLARISLIKQAQDKKKADAINNTISNLSGN